MSTTKSTKQRPDLGGQADPPGNLKAAHFHRGQWWAFRDDGLLVIWRHQRHVLSRKDGYTDAILLWHRVGSISANGYNVDISVPPKVLDEVTRAFYYLIAPELLPINRITP